ncbi:TBC1 domain family member 19 isoform X2 [Rhodnius prolixus]|uniref:TBC1 domain family member 19 isoform X2 n=1 Tax=Rhodnius prolixus TaxID=13249 RepID=UPI003D18B1C0
MFGKNLDDPDADIIRTKFNERLVASPAVKEDDFKNSLLNALKDSGMETELRNTIFHWLRSRKHPMGIKEPIAYLKKAQVQWEKRIHKSLNSMAAELKVALSQVRSSDDKEEIMEKWNELSVYDIDLSHYRPVYAPKDFLEVLLWIRSSNYRPIHPPEPSWDFLHLPLKVKTLNDLKSQYLELGRGELHLGVNPSARPIGSNYPTLSAERAAFGQKVITINHAPVTQEFLKKGSPRSLRAKLWAQVLGAEVGPTEEKYYKNLKCLVLQYDLMVDKLIIKDVQLTASNDHQYFVFEDLLYQVMLCFTRDWEILSVFKHSSATPLYGTLKGKVPNVENTVVYPPSGVIPFHGFTMYATPICYLYDDPIQLYFVFRAFYMRYWFRLHEVSSHEQGVLTLCLTFERLLHKHEFVLWEHLKKNSIQPVRLAFKWIMRAFSGHLPPEQVLFLWDLILAYDSLEILPLLALSIVSLRRESLLTVDTLQNCEAVLADLCSISVVPLIQMALVNCKDIVPPPPPENI